MATQTKNQQCYNPNNCTMSAPHKHQSVHTPHQRGGKHPLQPLFLMLQVFGFFVLTLMTGFGVGYLLSKSSPETQIGVAREVTSTPTSAAPHVDDYAGQYILVAVQTVNTPLETLFSNIPILRGYKTEETSPPVNDETFVLPDGSLGAHMPDQWVSSNFTYYLSRELLTRPKSHPAEVNEDTYTGESIKTLVKIVNQNQIDNLTQASGNTSSTVKIFAEPDKYSDQRYLSGFTMPLHVYTYLTTTPQEELPKIKVASNIRGRSSDLIYFLYHLETSQPGDLSNGYTVGATGILESSGWVQPVGGIIEKFDAFLTHAAANPEGGVFFYPQMNAGGLSAHTENLTLPPNVHLVPVTSAKQAAEWLCDNGGESAFCSNLN